MKGLIKGMLLGIKPEEAQGADTSLLKGIVDETAQRLDRGEIRDERILAEMHLLLGHAYTAVVDFDAAEPHLSKAVELNERLFGAAHKETLQARMQLALLRNSEGAVREAVRMQEEILPALLRVAEPDSEEVIGHRVNLAMGYAELKRLDEAEELMAQAYADARRALGEDAEYTLNAAGNLAIVYRAVGRLDEAEALVRQTYERRRKSLGELHVGTIGDLVKLAEIAYARQQYETADELMRKAIEQLIRVVGGEAPRTLVARRQLAFRLLERGRLDEVKPEIAELAEIAGRTLSPEHFIVLELQELRAKVLMMEGSHGEAARLLLDLAETARRVMGENTLRAANLHTRIALALAAIGRHAEARDILVRIHAVRRDQLGPDHLRTVAAQVGLADETARVGRLEEARGLLDDARERLLAQPDTAEDLRDWSEQVRARLLAAEGHREEAAALFEEVIGRWSDDDPKKEQVVQEAVDLALAGGQLPEATSLLRQRIALLEKNVGPDDVRTLLAKRNLGTLIQSQGKFDEAVRTVREAVEAMRSTLGPDHPVTLESEGVLAVAMGAKRDFAAAERVLLDAVEKSERVLGEEHLITADLHRRLGMVYMDWRRIEDAKRSLAVAVELETKVKGAPAYQDLERLGMIAQAERELEAAEGYYRSALDVAAKTLGEDDPRRLSLLLGHAAALQGLKRLEEAAAVQAEALQLTRALPRTHPQQLQALKQAAHIHQAMGRPAEALPLIQELVELSTEVHGAKAPAALSNRPILGLTLTTLGRHEEAVRVLTEGLDAAKESMGRENPLNGLFLLMLGNAYRAQGKWADGEKALREAKANCLRFQGPASPQAMLADIALAGLLTASERPQEAVAVLEPCLEQMREHLPPESELFEPATLHLARSYHRLGRVEDAKPLVKQLVETRSASLEEPYVSRGTLQELAELLLLEECAETYDPARALALAQRAYTLEREAQGGGAWSMLDTVARAQQKLGSREAALETVREAIQLAPEGRRAPLERLRAELEAQVK